MQTDEYIDIISEKLTYNYNVEKEKDLNGTMFDLHAICNVNNSKFIGSKKIVVYAYDNNSYIYVKNFKTLSIEDVRNVLDANAEKLLTSTQVDSEHMSTHYTIVFVTESSLPSELKNFIKKYRKQKSYAFGFKGWSSIGVVLVSLGENEIVYNKDARKIYKAFKSS